MFRTLFAVAAGAASVGAFTVPGRGRAPTRVYEQLTYDEQGYIVKPRDWFNGLSADPGASLTDPRAVPEPAKLFAEKMKAGEEVTFADTMAVIDESYNYLEVPFTNGDIENPANVNTGSAKIFSFALMTAMDEKAALGLFGEIARDLDPAKDDHQNIRSFKKLGWGAISFPTGLAIVSKLQSYDDTDSAMATQATLEGAGDWDMDSDSWIP